MKKILSLIMALTLVMGVNASFTPLMKKAVKKTPRLEQVQKQTVAQPATVKHAPKHLRHIDRNVIRKAPMASQTVIFAPVDFVDKGTSGTGSAISVTKEGVTVATDKGYGSRKYEEGVPKDQQVPEALRVYSGGELTISATSTITKIEFQVTESKYDGGLSSSYTPNATSWTETMSKQARITAITVTLGEGGDTPPTPPTPPTPGDTIPLTSLDAFEFGYYASYSEEGAYNYSLNIYNSQDENYVPYVSFDIYTEVKDDVTGDFTVENDNLGVEYSVFFPDADSEGEAMSDAFVTVKEGEGDELIVEGVFTTEAGETYSFSVTGEPLIYDAEHPYEPEEAKTFNLTAVDGEVDDSNFAEMGLVYYYLGMEDGSYVGLTYRTANGTQPLGTFDISDEEDKDAFLTGMDYYGYADGSFYETIDGYVYYLVSGSVTLATDEDGNTTISVNATSFYGSTFTVTGTVAAPQPTPGHTIVIADYADANFTTKDGAYTIATDKNGGETSPAYNENGADLRIYAKGLLTLTKNTKDGPMTKVIFNISTKGLTRQAELAVSTGKIISYDMTNATVTWEGEASEIEFTVGEKNAYGSDGKTKAGQFCFTSIDIEGSYSALDEVRTGVKAVKQLVNGQLVIEANGVRYNVLGTEF